MQAAVLPSSCITTGTPLAYRLTLPAWAARRAPHTLPHCPLYEPVNQYVSALYGSEFGHGCFCIEVSEGLRLVPSALAGSLLFPGML